MKKIILSLSLLCSMAFAGAQQYSHAVQVEKLNRGVVAVKAPNGVFVSWRSLTDDAPDMQYNVYRNGELLNSEPIKKCTCYNDAKGAAGDAYEVKCLVGDKEVDAQSVVAWGDLYYRIHLDRPEGGTSPAGGKDEQREYTYTPDDVSVGDVDGDGEYEYIVKWHPTNAADNSFRRYTGNTLIDCYKLDGTKLWRIDLGCNIRSGNHYTQFMVWDFDGDGKAEIICKTAPGTIDGKGKAVLMGSDKATDDYRNSDGIILKGSEYLTVFEGATGAEINTIAYNPPRSVLSNSAWGDSYGNRCERYLACVAYLDGKNPSAVFCRGYYTAAYVWAVDFDGSKLKERWLHKSETSGKGLYGEGAHAITVGDVDADGCDEIIYGAGALDHDGKCLYRTGLGHGDALHLAAMLPDREGLQVYMPHESKTVKYSAHMRDARTGEILFGLDQVKEDNGRGLCGNICEPAGYEYWSSKQRVPENAGEAVGTKSPSINFRIYWDGDFYDELLDGTQITKINKTNTSISTIVDFSKYSNSASCNSTKKTPNLQADLFGDWREEVILHDGTTESDLLIFTTYTPTDYKVTCLMQDRQYREAVAWQNVAYNQPPHLSYNLQESFNTAGVINITEGSLNQVVYSGDEITPVKFSVKRATGAEIKEGPEWLQIDFDTATLTGTLTGKAGEAGEYTVKIATTGASESDNGVIEGKIIVREQDTLSLMAYYPFDENGASTVNSIEGVAEAQNGDVAGVEGKIGKAAQFAGNYYVQPGYPTLDFGNGDFTLEFWFRSTDTAAYLFHKGSLTNDGDTHTGHWVGIELKNGGLKFGIDDDVTKSDLTVSNASQWFDGQWHHLVAIRDTGAKVIMLYIDGEKVGEATDATGAINCVAEDVVIGNVNVVFNNTYEGDIDDLSIYRGVMSPSQIRDRFNLTGITDVMMSPTAEHVLVVDAFTGIVAAEGSNLDIVDTVRKGIYVIMVSDRNGSNSYKFVKK